MNTYTITKKGSTPWVAGVVGKSAALAELRRACRVAGDHSVYDDSTGVEVDVEDLLDDDGGIER